MKNGAKPINPIQDLNKHPSGLLGLSKREYFAGLAMQGMCANPYMMEHHQKTMLKEAIDLADEILTQLSAD